MNPSVFKISLDIHNMSSQSTLAVKQGDTYRQMVISLVENGMPYQIPEGFSADFVAVRSDDERVRNACSIKGNTIVYNLSTKITEIAGELDCEVCLYNADGKQITSPRLTIIVDQTVASEEGVQEYLQAKTVTPTKSAQEIMPDSGYEGLSKVNVEPIPAQYIIPSGTKSITDNASGIDVTEYASVNVDVQPTLQAKTVTPTKSQQSVTPDSTYYGLSKVTVNAIPSSYVVPSGTKNITTNGTHSVSGYANASVNVPSNAPVLQVKTVTPSASQQDVNPDNGYNGLSKVVVLGDADLLAENVKNGVTIFGVTGTYKGEASSVEYVLVGGANGQYGNDLGGNSGLRDCFYSGDVNSITLSTNTGTDFVLGLESRYAEYITVTYGNQTSVNSYVTMSDSSLSYWLDLGTDPIYITAINVELMDGWDDYAEHYGYPPAEEKIAEVKDEVRKYLVQLFYPSRMF